MSPWSARDHRAALEAAPARGLIDAAQLPAAPAGRSAAGVSQGV